MNREGIEMRVDTRTRPANILVVDDEAENRRLVEAMLRPEGYLIQTAGNGEEALALVARQPPDLILLDVVMSGARFISWLHASRLMPQ
jgi:CheY-like chemotaxis protein